MSCLDDDATEPDDAFTLALFAVGDGDPTPSDFPPPLPALLLLPVRWPELFRVLAELLNPDPLPTFDLAVGDAEDDSSPPLLLPVGRSDVPLEDFRSPPQLVTDLCNCCDVVLPATRGDILHLVRTLFEDDG